MEVERQGQHPRDRPPPEQLRTVLGRIAADARFPRADQEVVAVGAKTLLSRSQADLATSTRTLSSAFAGEGSFEEI